LESDLFEFSSKYKDLTYRGKPGRFRFKIGLVSLGRRFAENT
jgi:hypothetical protein